eukprot:2847635-Alexandrium_andersonii.AAC.1
MPALRGRDPHLCPLRAQTPVGKLASACGCHNRCVSLCNMTAHDWWANLGKEAHHRTYEAEEEMEEE